MDSSRGFDRVDIVKLVVILVLLVVLIGVAIAPKLNSSQQQAEGLPTEAAEEPVGGEAGPAGTAVPTTVGMLPTPADLEGLPALPAPDQELTYNSADGSLQDEDGQAVYTLSDDGTIWIPVVPPDLADSLDNQVPSVDANGTWVLLNGEGMVQYQWDEATLSWVEVQVAYLPSLPGEAQPTVQTAVPATEIPVVATPVSPATPTAAPEQTGSEAPTQVPAGGEASGSASTAEGGQVAVPASLLSVPKTYSIHTGEFVYCLARRFDVNPGELLNLNGLSRYSIVFAGMKLRIPTSGKTFPPPRALLEHPATYTVKSGDTIYTIACKYGDVYPEAIAYANQLTAPYKLHAGQSLYIP